MVPLPPEAVHLSFEPGRFRMALGLFAVPDSAWFEIDALYPDEMRQRRCLLAEQHADVFATTLESDAARQEALVMIVANLATHHPAWFTRDGHTLHNHLTGEAWQIPDPGCDPLECAGRLVQEDLCLIQTADQTPVFTAGVLCFPSRWRLLEKIGKPLAAVHGPVPFYADRLARAVDRFMRQVKPGHIASRLNWSVLDNPALFQPTGKWRQAEDPAITAINAGDRLFLRVERQTLRRLPRSGAIVFGIRVHSYPLRGIVTGPVLAGRLASAVRALPSDVMHYKSMLPFQAALLAWLDLYSKE
jgi:hypothetical protein